MGKVMRCRSAGGLVTIVLLAAAAGVVCLVPLASCPDCEGSRVVWMYESGIAYVQKLDYPGLHVSHPPQLYACDRCEDRRRVTFLDRWQGRHHE